MIDVKEQQQYLAHFEQIEKQSSAAGQTWLLPIRKAAIARFTELGFPTLKDEEWRYTNVAPIAETPFEPAPFHGVAATPEQLTEYLFPGAAAVAVFVNGRFSSALSRLGDLPRGVRVESLAGAIRNEQAVVEPHLARYADYHHQPFVALNTALMEDGAFIYIPQGVVVEAPIHLLYFSMSPDQPLVSHPRTLIIAEANSQANIVESYAGLEPHRYFTNAVTELIAAQNAVLDHCKVERESHQAYHIGALRLQMDRDSTVRSHAVSLGGALVRNNINAVLDGEGVECALNGLYMIGGTQHVDNHLRVEHAKPHCDSREFFKGVLDQQARGIFSGRIVVREGAQKTDAKQTNMSLLLSEQAQIESKPQLEIFADDVKCTHGATIGQVSEDAVFYLRSRGISEKAARSLLVFTFAGESLAKVRVEPLRAKLEQLMLKRLPQGHILQELS